MPKIKIHRKHYLTAIVFSLLQKDIDSDAIIEKLKEKDIKSNKFERIRCPKCSWQPKPSSLWFCLDCDAPEFFYQSCGTHWHTFETNGKCPGCQHQWHWTSCLSCSEWSLHEDWYAKDSKK